MIPEPLRAIRMSTRCCWTTVIPSLDEQGAGNFEWPAFGPNTVGKTVGSRRSWGVFVGRTFENTG